MNNLSNSSQLQPLPGPLFFVELYWWCDKSSVTVKVMTPIIMILGFAGNALSLVTVTRKRVRKIQHSFILATLAVTDTVVLIASALNIAVRTFTKGEFDLYVNGNCSFMYFLLFTCGQLSAFLMTLIAAERFIAVYKPLQTANILTPPVIRRLILIWTIFLLAVNSNAFVVWGPYATVQLGSLTLQLCSCWAPVCSAFVNIWPVIDGILYSWGPSAIIVVLNVLTTSKLLHRYLRSRRAVAPTATAGPSSHGIGGVAVITQDVLLTPAVQSSDRQEAVTSAASILLLTITTIYVCCTMPIAIATLYINVWFDTVRFGVDQVCDNVNIYVWFAILMNINHALNFYLYCLVGSNFRKELKLWLKLPWCWNKGIIQE